MPTIRSTSADRSAISVLERTPCACMASANWEPIDLTGFSAFIALCMTTDRFFHLIEAISLSVSPTMLRPLKVTLPPVTSAGGTSSWAIANSRVDLPQPDSPTMPRNSPAARSKLTASTAKIVPRSMMYSTDRSRTSSTLPVVSPGPPSSKPSPGALDTGPPARNGGGNRASPGPPADRPQGRVTDLVECVVEQRERPPQGDDAQAGRDDPQWRDLERLVVLGPVQHRAPAGHVRVAEPDELQAGGEQHRVQRVSEEGGHEQRRHRRDDLHADDVQRALAADLRRVEEVPVAQRQRLSAELACGVRPAGQSDDRDHHRGAGPVQVAADDDEQREQRDDQEHVGEHVERPVPGPAEIGGGHADQHRDDRGQQPHTERDQEHRPGAVDQLREHVLAERGGAEQVPGGDGEQPRIDLRVRVIVRDDAGERRDKDEEQQQHRTDGCLAVSGDRPRHTPYRPGTRYRASAGERQSSRRGTSRAAGCGAGIGAGAGLAGPRGGSE